MTFLAAAIILALLAGCVPQGPMTSDIKKPTKGVPMIRVKLADDTPNLWVAVDGPWRLSCSGRTSASATALGWAEVRSEGGGIVVGGQNLGAGPVEIAGQQDGTLRVRQVVGDACRERGYRGTLRVIRTREGLLRPVNVVNLEAYLAGVVCKEMPASWHLEALKAQAVAARTFAIVQRNGRTATDFDVYDTVQSQVYAGLESETEKARKAVAATWGVVGSWRGRGGKPALLHMYFHSTCGGSTDDAGAIFGGEAPPPLRGVDCRYCYRSKRYEWSGVVLTKQEIGDALHRSADPAVRGLGPLARLEVAAETLRGRVTRLRLVDARGAEATIGADRFRLLVGPSRVASNWFAFADSGDSILFAGRGSGHGVGLCQWGAEYLAEQGKTGEEILRYYYPGVDLVRAY